jgi:polyhydroxybutyrate depolymerase
MTDINGTYSIDPSRIHTTGLSIGAAIAFRVACELPDKIASAAGVGLYLYLNKNIEEYSDCKMERPFSAMQIHGTADGIILYDGMELAGYPLPPVPETISFWAMKNNCSTEPSMTELNDVVASDSSTVSKIEYSDCDDDAEVILLRVNNGGHTWPGGGPQGSGLGFVNNDFNASSEMWRFFERNPMP